MVRIIHHRRDQDYESVLMACILVPMVSSLWYRMLALLLCLSLGISCDKSDDSPTVDDILLTDVQADIDALIDQGLEAELPPPLSSDELEEIELRLHRRQVADEMATAVHSSMAPLAIAAAVFAPEGAVDLLLTVLPVHKVGKAAQVARDALDLRRRNKRAKKLVAMHDEFRSLLSRDADEFVRLASRLARKEQRAIRKIFDKTGSAPVVQALMRKHLQRDADITWIASKLERAHLDKDFARRFTFDADLVEEYSLHDANPSWRVLEDIVEGRAVDDALRASLVSKVTGLLGERAAMARVRSSAFTGKYFPMAGGADLAEGAGLRYQRGMSYGQRGSLDIVASDQSGNAVFVEVKNAAANTWSDSYGDTVLAQLDRHDHGIAETLMKSGDMRAVSGKVLMVREDGYQAWVRRLTEAPDKDPEKFKKAVEARGWALALMPDDEIPRFEELIDALR